MKTEYKTIDVTTLKGLMQAAYVKQEIDPINRTNYTAYQPPYLRDRTQYE